jgi:hypothetical protein
MVVRPSVFSETGKDELVCTVIARFRSALNEREQVGVDGIGLRRDHAVRTILVSLPAVT